MLFQNISPLINLFSYCTFQIFRNHSADLISPSWSLADHLILTQSNPIILENLEDYSFVNHRYFVMEASGFKNKSVIQHPKFESVRLSCHILLVDFQGVSTDIWRNKGRIRNRWRTQVIHGLLKGLGGFRESPKFIIFQGFEFNSNHSDHQSFFKSYANVYAVKSPYIFLTHSGIFLFCKTCPGF